jgi:hypothetical protein
LTFAEAGLVLLSLSFPSKATIRFAGFFFLDFVDTAWTWGDEFDDPGGDGVDGVGSVTGAPTATVGGLAGMKEGAGRVDVI